MTTTVVLISTFELGRQPFGLSAPAAMLRDAGAVVDLQDLAIVELDEAEVRSALLVAIHVPMHTATRLAQQLIPRIKQVNPTAHVCVYGLYASLNEDHLRSIGADSVFGGECENRLVDLFRTVNGPDQKATTSVGEAVVSVAAQPLVTPDRRSLPPLDQYARLVQSDGRERIVGYTEASRGCRHRCRHCPVVPVYNGRFRAVPAAVVLADIEQQIEAGAQHVTFGDPDFFNGPVHARRVSEQLHVAHPDVTYDVTIKIEHLRRHTDLVEHLHATGCVLVTSAVESFDEEILERFEKHHSPDDLVKVIEEFRRIGLAFNPTFVAFTPWTSLNGYRHFLRRISDLGLISNVSPIQYGIRLLITENSRLLELPDIGSLVDDFDQAALCYRWRHSDPAVDDLQRSVMALVASSDATGLSRHQVFDAVCDVAGAHMDRVDIDVRQPISIPYMTEPWYC